MAFPPATLIHTAGDIAALMSPADYLAAAETAFRAAAARRSAGRLAVALAA
jgi:hypothetical protein